MSIFPTTTFRRSYSRWEEGHNSRAAEIAMGSAWTNDETLPVWPNDLIHFRDREQHYLKSDGLTDLRFLQLHVPGEFKTIWVNAGEKSAWRSTDLNIHGSETTGKQVFD